MPHNGILGHFWKILFEGQYCQYGYPWKEHQKCSTEQKTRGLYLQPIKSYDQIYKFRHFYPLTYTVKYNPLARPLPGIFRQNIFSNYWFYIHMEHFGLGRISKFYFLHLLRWASQHSLTLVQWHYFIKSPVSHQYHHINS